MMGDCKVHVVSLFEKILAFPSLSGECCHHASTFERSQNSLKEKIMKVKIDYDLCMGDRNCNKVCPEVFEYDEDQMVSHVLVDEVPEHLEDLVRKAAEECAPGAIVVEE
ncbi:MAG: ferredoxin [Desulfobacteraceae bacterium]|jgi:ferredoxin